MLNTSMECVYAFLALVGPSPWDGKRSMYRPFEFVHLVNEKGAYTWLSIQQKKEKKEGKKYNQASVCSFTSL